MSFCPKCGAALKGESAQATAPPTSTPTSQPPVQMTREKQEKQEKQEKGEKHEKGETREKAQFSFIAPIIAGVVILFFALLAFLAIAYPGVNVYYGPFVLVIIGIGIIIGAIYGATMARRRYPRT